MTSTRREHNIVTGAAFPRALVLTVLTSGVALLKDSIAEQPWYYTLGKQKLNQQATFCLKKQTIRELVRTFKDEGPRPGYAALERASECRNKVQSFTPLKVVGRVTIRTGDGGRYTVSFVKVATTSGATEYLVTTREVREQDAE